MSCLIPREACFSPFQHPRVSLQSLWSSVILHGFSVFLAKESFTQAWSTLVKSKERTKAEENSVGSQEARGDVSERAHTAPHLLREWLCAQRGLVQFLSPLSPLHTLLGRTVFSKRLCPHKNSKCGLFWKESPDVNS